MIDFVQLKKVAQEAQESQVPFTINSTQILELLAIQAQLVAALKDITGDISERFDMESSSTNPGIKNCVENARAAIAAVGAQP